MAEIISALAPIFLTIALGTVLKRIGMPGDSFWPLVERVTYYVLFPALLITATASDGFAAGAAIPMATSLMGTILLLTLLLLVARPILPFSGPSFSSVFQGGLRYNTFVAMAAVGALYGDEGLALAGIAVAAMVPLLNLLSVAIVAYFGDGNDNLGTRAIVRLVVTNPLIIACVIGIALGASGIRLPGVATETLTILGQRLAAACPARRRRRPQPAGLPPRGGGHGRCQRGQADPHAHRRRPAVPAIRCPGNRTRRRDPVCRLPKRYIRLHPRPATGRRRRTAGHDDHGQHRGRGGDHAGGVAVAVLTSRTGRAAGGIRRCQCELVLT